MRQKIICTKILCGKMGVRDTMCEDCCENVQQDIDSLSVKEKKRLRIIE